MKIVYLHQYFKTPSMSGGTRSYEMARRLVQAGHEVHMVTSETEPHKKWRGWRQGEEGGIHVHWVSIPYSNHMTFTDRIHAFLKFAWQASRRASALRGDVVFASSTPLTIAFPGLFAAKRRNAPFVFEVRDLWPEVPIAVHALRSPLTIAGARGLELLAYRHAEHIVALSPGMKDGIVRRGIQPDRITVIPNGCDLDLFGDADEEAMRFRKNLAWLQDRPLVLYAGTLGGVNGVDYLADLAAEARKSAPSIRFLVIGNGCREREVRNRAEALGVLGENFFMWDRVAKNEIPKVLGAASVATSLTIDIPEMWANSANKVFDALAAGCPVAVNHGGWIADLIRDRGLGLVWDPKDLPASARSLIGFLECESAQTRARNAARRTAEDLFDRDALAAKLEEVLINAVKQRRARDGLKGAGFRSRGRQFTPNPSEGKAGARIRVYQ